jgi:hypothetical protein
VQEGLRDVVVATTWGDTGLAFAERFEGSGDLIVLPLSMFIAYVPSQPIKKVSAGTEVTI